MSFQKGDVNEGEKNFKIMWGCECMYKVIIIACLTTFYIKNVQNCWKVKKSNF